MKKLLLFLLIGGLAGAFALHVRYGPGEPYRDLTATPVLADDALQTVLAYPEPIGNVAVSADGRIFFTVHPESRPQGNRLLEWVDGAAEPFPSGSAQPRLFDTVLGVVVDRQNRLWTIDHGNHGFRGARLLAFDLASGELVHDHAFTKEVAPAGSMLQDLHVTADGQTVLIADASIWRKRPAIVVYDTGTRSARRVLESDPSVSPEDYLIRTRSRDMSYLGGLISLKAGVDGIALDADNEWLYFGAINQSGLFRVPLAALLDASLPDRQIANQIERFADKPMSDGLSTDLSGNVYITDVEHGAVLAADPSGQLTTVVMSERVRWADDLSFGPDGWLYLADSAMQELILQTSAHIEQQAPYYIFRFRPGHQGIAGQ